MTRHFGSKRPSRKADHTEATLFLLNARSLDGVTAEWLAHRYRIPAAKAGVLLDAARGRRGHG